MTHSDPVGLYDLVEPTGKGGPDHLWKDTHQFREWRIGRAGVGVEEVTHPSSDPWVLLNFCYEHDLTC